MDESLLELENELKRLTPRGPSVALLAALEHELEPATTAAPVRHYSAATRLRSWKWMSWSLAGAAIAAALIVLVQTVRQPTAAPIEPAVPSGEMAAAEPAAKATPATVVANRYEPVQASSVLYDLQESDPTTLPDRTEGREVRYRYVDTYTWKNPATKASVRWSVPRDEVRLIRANLD